MVNVLRINLCIYLGISFVMKIGGSRITKYSCEGTSLTMECEPQSVIEIVRANYGRLSSSVCNEAGNIEWDNGCIQRSTKSILDSRCSHSQVCTIPVTSAVFGDACPGTKKYLEVHYQCRAINLVTTTEALLPPWLLDISVTPPSSYKRELENIEDENIVITKQPCDKDLFEITNVTKVTSTVEPLKDWFKGGELEAEPANSLDHTTLVVSVTITTISSVVIVILYLFIRRQFQPKTPPSSLAQCSCPTSMYSYYGSSTNTTSTNVKCGGGDYQIPYVVEGGGTREIDKRPTFVYSVSDIYSEIEPNSVSKSIHNPTKNVLYEADPMSVIPKRSLSCTFPSDHIEQVHSLDYRKNQVQPSIAFNKSRDQVIKFHMKTTN